MLRSDLGGRHAVATPLVHHVKRRRLHVHVVIEAPVEVGDLVVGALRTDGLADT